MDSSGRFSVIFVLSLLFFVSSTLPVSAQRVIDGQNVVNVQGAVAPGGCFALGWSRCDYHGQTVFSANVCRDDASVFLTEDELVQVGDRSLRPYDIYASGGYLFRLASTRSRGVMLYGGGTLDFGYRSYDFELYEQKAVAGDDGFRYSSSVSDNPTLGSHFIFGVTPELGVQLFPFKKTAVSLFVKPRMRFNGMGNEPWFVPSAGLGLHFYI